MEELRNLFRSVTFEDFTEGAVSALCQLIVDGKKVDYKFHGMHDSPGEWDAEIYSDKGEMTDHVSIYIPNLIEQLLIRSDLIEVRKAERGDSVLNTYFFARPTQKALQFYERLQQEGLIDSDGHYELGK